VVVVQGVVKVWCIIALDRGATDEIRTRDLTITNRLLYQLSYGGDL
jgi:hypothetical protein